MKKRKRNSEKWRQTEVGRRLCLLGELQHLTVIKADSKAENNKQQLYESRPGMYKSIYYAVHSKCKSIINIFKIALCQASSKHASSATVN
jgi:hypothetical protein